MSGRPESLALDSQRKTDLMTHYRRQSTLTLKYTPRYRRMHMHARPAQGCIARQRFLAFDTAPSDRHGCCRSRIDAMLVLLHDSHALGLGLRETCVTNYKKKKDLVLIHHTYTHTLDARAPLTALQPQVKLRPVHHQLHGLRGARERKTRWPWTSCCSWMISRIQMPQQLVDPSRDRLSVATVE